MACFCGRGVANQSCSAVNCLAGGFDRSSRSAIRFTALIFGNHIGVGVSLQTGQVEVRFLTKTRPAVRRTANLTISLGASFAFSGNTQMDVLIKNVGAVDRVVGQLEVVGVLQKLFRALGHCRFDWN